MRRLRLALDQEIGLTNFDDLAILFLGASLGVGLCRLDGRMLTARAQWILFGLGIALVLL